MVYVSKTGLMSLASGLDTETMVALGNSSKTHSLSCRNECDLDIGGSDCILTYRCPSIWLNWFRGAAGDGIGIGFVDRSSSSSRSDDRKKIIMKTCLPKYKCHLPISLPLIIFGSFDPCLDCLSFFLSSFSTQK